MTAVSLTGRLSRTRDNPTQACYSKAGALEYMDANNIKVVGVKSGELKARLDDLDFCKTGQSGGSLELVSDRDTGAFDE